MFWCLTLFQLLRERKPPIIFIGAALGCNGTGGGEGGGGGGGFGGTSGSRNGSSGRSMVNGAGGVFSGVSFRWGCLLGFLVRFGFPFAFAYTLSVE